MFARYVCAISNATAMTFALLYVMQVLISFQQPANGTAARPHFFLHPVRVVSAPPPPPERQKFDELKEPLPRAPGRPGPAVPAEPVTQLPDIPAGPGIPRPAPGPDIGVPADAPLIRVLAVEPAYPAGASRLGMEGWVIVEFDVRADGTVTNATVVESSHAGFEKAALEAAARFRFRARVVDGIPQPSTGLRNRFVFRMADDA